MTVLNSFSTLLVYLISCYKIENLTCFLNANFKRIIIIAFKLELESEPRDLTSLANILRACFFARMVGSLNNS